MPTTAWMGQQCQLFGPRRWWRRTWCAIGPGPSAWPSPVSDHGARREGGDGFGQGCERLPGSGLPHPGHRREPPLEPALDAERTRTDGGDAEERHHLDDVAAVDRV